MKTQLMMNKPSELLNYPGKYQRTWTREPQPQHIHIVSRTITAALSLNIHLHFVQTVFQVPNKTKRRNSSMFYGQAMASNII